MTMTTLPPAPLPTDDTATFNTRAFSLVAALNPFVTEANALEAAVDADATSAAANASSAASSAIAATGAANFKGEWSTLSGALAIPASVSYVGEVWILTVSVSNVAAEVPGVSIKWIRAHNANLARLDLTQAFTKAQSFTPVALTSASASIATDLALANNFTHTLTENTVLANPTNLVAGQSGRIKFTNHASAPKTLAYGSYWLPVGGVVQALTASNSAVDLLVYEVDSATTITFKLVKDRK